MRHLTNYEDFVNEQKKLELDPKQMPQKSDRLGKGGSFEQSQYGNLAKEEYFKLLKSKPPKTWKRIRLIFPKAGWEVAALKLIKELGVITGVYKNTTSALKFVNSLVKKGVKADELIIGSHGTVGALLMTKEGKDWYFDNSFLDAFKPIIHEGTRVFFTACNGADYLETVRDASERLGVPVYASAGIYNYVTDSSEKGFYMCYPKKLTTKVSSSISQYDVKKTGELRVRYATDDTHGFLGTARITVDPKVFGIAVGPFESDGGVETQIGSDQPTVYSKDITIKQLEIEIDRVLEKEMYNEGKYSAWEKKMNSFPGKDKYEKLTQFAAEINRLFFDGLIKVELKTEAGKFVNVKDLPPITTHKVADNKYLLDGGYCKKYNGAPTNWVQDIISAIEPPFVKDIRQKLSESLDDDLLYDNTIYSNDPKISTDELTQIIDSTEPTAESQVMTYVASHPNLSQEDQSRLLKMSQDPEYGYGYKIRYGLSKNPNINKETIETLIADPADTVRGSLARNEKIDADTAGILSRDPDWFVRSMAALNPVLRTSDLYELTLDPHSGVRECASFKMAQRNPINDMFSDMDL